MLVSMTVSGIVAGTIATGGAKAAAATAVVSSATRKVDINLIPTIDPLGLVGVIAMTLPVAVLFAAIAFTVSLFAKSYKEAQSYLAPLMIFVFLPAGVGMLPGIDLNAKLALVPLLNLSLVCREMLAGEWHWNYIGLIFGSTSVYAGVALALAVKMFNREDVIFRT
jgi:sodium transport system permease protein